MKKPAEFLVTFAAALVVEFLLALAFADTTGRPLVIGDAIFCCAILAVFIAWAATTRRFD